MLRVSIHCEGCKRKVKKVLQKIDGTHLDEKEKNFLFLFVLKKKKSTNKKRVTVNIRFGLYFFD